VATNVCGTLKKAKRVTASLRHNSSNHTLPGNANAKHARANQLSVMGTAICSAMESLDELAARQKDDLASLVEVALCDAERVLKNVERVMQMDLGF
jgi:hypothetical protein